MGSAWRSLSAKRSNETTKHIVLVTVGVIIGILIGLSFPTLSLTKLDMISGCKLSLAANRDSPEEGSKDTSPFLEDSGANSTDYDTNPASSTENATNKTDIDRSKIWVPSNPRGAERLPPAIVESSSDFYLRRLWGKPSEDLASRPNYLVAFTVGLDQKSNIDAAVKKFSENFTIVLFHYDGRVNEWDEFEWSRRAIHVSAKKQTKWWFAKRFLHPDIVAPYDYIFIWDEDLGVEHFDAEKYIELVKKHGLEISQPGVEPNKWLTWYMTRRRPDHEVHKQTEERPGWCPDPNLPPCAAFVEIMAPVFSRDAWRCTWHLIQNDLVHGWGLDFALQKCVEPPVHEKIGVVDAQWIDHKAVPTLRNQGEAVKGKSPWNGVRERCNSEWAMFRERLKNAEEDHYKSMATAASNLTSH